MRKYISSALVLLLSVGSILAQTSSQDAAKLRKDLETVNVRKDSIQKALNECRNNYETDPQKYGSKIVQLEGLMYEVNEQQSILSRQVAQLPADQSQTNQKSNTTFKGKNIADSPFFKDNVSKQDLAQFKQSAAVYQSLEDAKYQIDSKYQSLLSMKDEFDKTDSQDKVDKIIIEAENLKKEISTFDLEISEQWNNYYNAHIENYLVMIDKLGNVPRSKLESLDLLARQAQSSVNPEETLAPSIADIKAQNQLILAYEEILAERLGYTLALDSIHKEIEKVKSMEMTLYPNVAFPYRTTCVYGAPTLGNSYSYSKPSEIPEVKIPETGVYYSIQLYASQTPVQQLSTFKGAEPLQKCKSGSYYKYLVGGFRTYSEAYKSLVKMQKSFKAPRIVAWLNGTATTTDKAKLSESSKADGGYSIQVKSSKPSTGTTIKEVIEIHAPGKNWTSNDSPAGGKIYRIMSFESKEEAAVIAQIIRTKDSSSEVEVIEN